MSGRCIIGDCLAVLPTLESGSVQCCVTSPPYWGLRSYGIGTENGELGLESTPEEYVAKMVTVFREVKRVLRDDGTLWLNLGDSYVGANNTNHGGNANWGSQPGRDVISPKDDWDGLRPKNLVGIPWRVAFALQQPYYTGNIKDERDRVWLAAMLDAEGCITVSEYETGGKLKTNIAISITNSSVPIIDKCERLFPQEVKHVYEKGGTVNRVMFRWDVEQLEKKALFIREIYPHLVAKRKQAILGYTFLELQRGLFSKKKGYLPLQQEQRSWLVKSIQNLNQGRDVDLPDWAVEPPHLFEEGYYLRQDLIWAKPNPMPESVRDRCTKSHEYIFLLSKSERYYFDADAIAEPQTRSTLERAKYGWNGRTDDNSNGARTGSTFKRMAESGEPIGTIPADGMRNKRSVWTVSTKPFTGSHFAVFPPDLIEPCILAGSKPGDVVLDPFGGSGTVGQVCESLGRKWLLIELNPAYAQLAADRTAQQGIVLV